MGILRVGVGGDLYRRPRPLKDRSGFAREAERSARAGNLNVSQSFDDILSIGAADPKRFSHDLYRVVALESNE